MCPASPLTVRDRVNLETCWPVAHDLGGAELPVYSVDGLVDDERPSKPREDKSCLNDRH